MKTKHQFRTQYAVAFATLVLSHAALGQITTTYEWVLGAGAAPELSSWATAANWNPAAVPLSLSDAARITNGGTGIIQGLVSDLNVGSIFVAGGTGGSNLTVAQDLAVSTRQIRVGQSSVGTVTMNAGTLQLYSQEVAEVIPPELVIGVETGGFGTFTQIGGTLDTSATTFTNGHPDTRIGAFGASGVYNLQGGSSNLWNLRVGFANAASVGTINHSGGTLSHTGELALGWADATGNYNLSGNGQLLQLNNRIRVGATAGTHGTFSQSGGTAVITGGRLELGTESGAHGTYNMSGGTMTVFDDIFVGAFDDGVPKGTTGVYNQTGGAVTANRLWIGFDIGSSGTVHLGGGTLRVERIFMQPDKGTGTLTFGGGTLIAKGGGDIILGFPLVTVSAGGATIDSNDNGVTIVPPLVGPGGLTKTGENQLTLTAINNYDGNTAVNNGRLILTHPGGLNPASTVSILNVQDGADAKLVLQNAGTDTVSKLIVDGVEQAPGLYGALDNPTEGILQRGFIQGAGLLLVEPAVGYDNWASNPDFALYEDQKGPDQDPDNDGLANLLEYSLGGNPSISDPGIAPELTLAGADMEISFERSVDSASDTTAVIQWSTDLQSWPAENEIEVSGTGTITKTIPGSNAQNGKIFARLKVTKP